MVDQRFYSLDEAHRVRHPCVKVKRSFVGPPRMNVEKSWIAHRAKSVKAQATLFFAGRGEHITQCLSDRVLLTLKGMKPRKDEYLHRYS
jgi:hypothetical protein